MTSTSHTPVVDPAAHAGFSPFDRAEGVVVSGVYDYVFTGAGCAGLSLLMHLDAAGLLHDKRVLVIDQDNKQHNDRTWCFWEQGAGLFESIVYKRWDQLDFFAPRFSGPLRIDPYQYKLIRGVDFYRHCLAHLQQQPQITWLKAPVSGWQQSGAVVTVQAGRQQVTGKVVFNSIVPGAPQLAAHQYWLLQHFKGWVIETPEDHFDPERATLMDFRVGQEQGCTFMYVLPFSSRRALVEYTLFSPALLPEQAYSEALSHYLQQFLGIRDYRIVESEFGIIPMSNYAFPHRQGSVVHLGTAGGQTKASSGYTFRFIQQHAARIVDSIQANGHPFGAAPAAARFNFYDSVLLHILQHRQLPGADIFATLFRRNRASAVFRFLDNATSLPQELRLIATLPTFRFARAALQYLWARLRP